MKGIQYDLATGLITGCCSPPVDLTTHPDWPPTRGQIIVDGSVDISGMKVDITQDPPLVVPDNGG